MTFPVGSAAYPTAAEIRDQILSDLTYYGRQRGITYNVKEGSDYWNLALSLANRLAIGVANNQLSNDDRNPLIATGTALRDIARVYGIEERPASISAGSATVKTSASTTIPAGWQCTGPNGLKYQTTATTTVTNGQSVTLRSMSTGEGTVLTAGQQLTWDSAAIATLLNPATVGDDGIVGGQDADDDDVIRRRLLDRLAQQAVGGNGASIKGWAEEPSAAVYAAYVYEAVRGPGSVDVAIVREDGDRTLPGTIVTQSRSNVRANMPGGVVSINATSVVNEALDIILEMTLPLPSTAGGSGGGWLDADPWPAELTQVTAIADTTLTVDAIAQPSVGQAIGFWDASDPDEPVMQEREILTVVGSTGAWEITVDGSVSFVEVGDYVSAGAANLVAYAATFYAQMVALGPGEKTDNVDILPRALRYPPPDISDPYELTSRQITEVQAAYDEIAHIAYAARYETGTTTTRVTPSLPPTTASAPRILTLGKLAIIKKA